jgi:hypothetical protein
MLKTAFRARAIAELEIAARASAPCLRGSAIRRMTFAWRLAMMHVGERLTVVPSRAVHACPSLRP